MWGVCVCPFIILNILVNIRDRIINQVLSMKIAMMYENVEVTWLTPFFFEIIVVLLRAYTKKKNSLHVPIYNL